LVWLKKNSIFSVTFYYLVEVSVFLNNLPSFYWSIQESLLPDEKIATILDYENSRTETIYSAYIVYPTKEGFKHPFALHYNRSANTISYWDGINTHLVDSLEEALEKSREIWRNG
jgi:hypothetical protein